MFKQVLLKEITKKIGSGATPTGGKEAYKEEGVSLIRSMNVYNFSFEYEGLAHIDEKQAKRLDGVKVEKDDILLNITGASVGRCVLVPENVLPARVNQHVAIIRINKLLADSKFILYCINAPIYKDRLLSLSDDGATREALTKVDIEKFEILLPDLPTQHRIAGILSAYDELIEVNTQRIRLLEETARQLYKEWFVRMRFPGYEQATFVKGLPVGWKVRKVSDLCSINANSASKFSDQELINYVDISSVGTGQINEITSYEFKDAPGRARRVVKHDDIIFATVRPENRCYSLIQFPLKNLIVSTGFVTLSPKSDIPPAYIYFYISSDSFIEDMVNKSKGSAYPQVGFDDIKNSAILKPNAEFLVKFSSVSKSIFEQIETLQQQNIQLRQLRDRLLPRLVSGKLEVSSSE